VKAEVHEELLNVRIFIQLDHGIDDSLEFLDLDLLEHVDAVSYLCRTYGEGLEGHLDLLQHVLHIDCVALCALHEFLSLLDKCIIGDNEVFILKGTRIDEETLQLLEEVVGEAAGRLFILLLTSLVNL
jgi:hypothetical protein